MDMEIAGHEFCAADGKTIWYDLQTPRGQGFLARRLRRRDGKKTRYKSTATSGRSTSTSRPTATCSPATAATRADGRPRPDGKWIYLFRPERVPDVAGIPNPNGASLIDPGFFKAERLVNMGKHDYRLEPNVTFSPGPEVDRVPVEHARTDACVRRRDTRRPPGDGC